MHLLISHFLRTSHHFIPDSFSNAVNEQGSVGGIPGEVKPRSLRFTWSMKTTSSRDPNEIMAEIKKVRVREREIVVIRATVYV